MGATNSGWNEEGGPDLPSQRPPQGEEAARARRVVAAHASTVDEYTELMRMLGLDDQDGGDEVALRVVDE